MEGVRRVEECREKEVGGEHEGSKRSSGERSKRESKERDILTEGVIMGLVRNLTLGKSQESTRMTPTKTLSNSGKDA